MARVNKSIFLLFENNLLIIIIQIISATEGGCNKGRKVWQRSVTCCWLVWNSDSLCQTLVAVLALTAIFGQYSTKPMSASSYSLARWMNEPGLDVSKERWIPQSAWEHWYNEHTLCAIDAGFLYCAYNFSGFDTPMSFPDYLREFRGVYYSKMRCTNQG